jgi:glycosyltransferase involved in cell wall biosynthesis
MKERKKKIAFVVNSLYGGGAERVMQVVLQNLDRARFDITLVNHRREEVNPPYPGDIKYRSILKHHKRFWNRAHNKINQLVYNNLPPRVFRALWLREKFDVEIAFIEGYATRMVAGGRASKKIAWVHIDLEANPWSDIAFRSKSEQTACYRQLDRVICVSDSVREAFERRFGVKAETLYNPIDSEAIRAHPAPPTHTAPPTPRRRPLFVTSGRLVEQKGYDRLLDTAARLRDEGCDFELWILGDGALRSQLEQQIARLNLADRVTMWGFVDNPYPWIAAGDLFVCSSRSEGYSTAATEAIILGVPVVTTLCAGMRELLGENGEGGGWIVPNDDNALDEPLRKIARDPACLEPLRQNAKRRGDDFSISRSMNPIEELLANGDFGHNTGV